ncbi:MAG TPA: aminotransferase class V-fold PLP-dependent enzyme [Flavobacteriales bacterium]|nr:aminotransferase class V-fold PLP-dependent enzyme [Flavobacteriales bacterium]HMR27353.1 aminotransferase class V-fold PLP-dependent enzyme [Flavobacteriales bacterium]
MSLNVDRARSMTPGCAHRLHFNNAGAGLMPLPVVEAVKAHLDRESHLGGYEAAMEAAPLLENTYAALARLLNCGTDEIALQENATRAWDMAFHSVPLGPGDVILTGHAEYVSNWLSMLQVCRRTGCAVQVVPNGPDGAIDLDALRRMLDHRVKLVALTHAPSSSGLINPAEEVGAIVRGSGALFLLDACQSVGQRVLDVERIGCDLLSATGRKFLRGPRGTGFLYVRRSVLDRLEPPFVDHFAASWTDRDTFIWRPDARRFEDFEHSVACRIGLGAAVDHALSFGMAAISTRTAALAEDLRTGLAALPGVVVRDTGTVRGGIVTFSMEGHDPLALQAAYADKGINVSVARHEIARLDLEERGIDRVVRASPHYYNTVEELDRFLQVTRRMVDR